MSRIDERLRSEESGFTLVEVLVAMIIGIVILLASFTMLDTSVVLTGKVTDRVDRTQRSRLAMETITRELRSQVCPAAGTTPLIAGDAYSVTFYSFLGSGTFVPDKMQIAWDTNTNSIVEKKWAGTTASPYTTWAATPTQRTLLSDVRPLTPTAQDPNPPVFSYSNGINAAFTVPLAAADMKNTSKVAIQFQTYATGRAPNGLSIKLQSEVFVRTADPNRGPTVIAPECA